jgi:hypothetical protein
MVGAACTSKQHGRIESMRNADPDRLNPIRLRAELHIGILVTLSATFLYVAADHPAAKLLGALLAGGGASKVAAHWQLLGHWAAFVMSWLVASFMFTNFVTGVGVAVHHPISGTLGIILGFLLGVLGAAHFYIPTGQSRRSL